MAGASPAMTIHLLMRRAVVAFDDDEIELALAFAQVLRGLILGRVIAIERGLEARKLKHHGAAAHLAFRHLAGAAAHQETAAELAEGGTVGGLVGLVAFGVG